jgi:hypothetical protein
MRKWISAGFALSLAVSLSACSGGGGSGGTAEGTVSLAGSRQGQSGGFVDVDGDGDADKVVGAPYAEASSQTGALLVYKRSGDAFDTRPSMVLTGDDTFGFSFANVGDVDGDGFDDFAVGAINGSGDQADQPSLSGTVSVYRGGTDGELLKKLAGEGPLDKFGYAVAGGDLDGDGYDDVIVGAPFNSNDPALYAQGAVYVFFGPDLSRSVALHASASNKGLGWSVEAGDVNGDGVADLLFGITGKVLGYYGGASFSPDISTPDLSVASAAAGFGRTLRVLGDLDGDELAEFAVGAPTAVVNNERDTGCLYIVKGGTGSRTIDLGTDPPDLLVRICGGDLFNRFGSAIALAGDTDQDGKPDFAVSAPLADCGGKPVSGRVYFFKGKDITAAATLGSASGFDAMAPNQGYGTFLASTGQGELLIGGPGSTANTGGVGMVDLSTGQAVPGGSSGGDTGGSGSCH